MSERPIYEGRIRNQRLYLPKDKSRESEILESIVEQEPRFMVSYFRLQEGDLLLVYKRETFEKKFKHILHLPPYDSLTPEEREKAYWMRLLLSAHTEWTDRDNKGHIRFVPYSLINFYRLPLSQKSIPLTKKIDERVRIIHAHDFLGIIRPEDEEKFRRIQSTVNSSESCPTSNNPNLAPASSQP
ncbi:MAG: hypothetical protein QW165_02150 [Candidatus Woesearchaeota archaeon]